MTGCFRLVVVWLAELAGLAELAERMSSEERGDNRKRRGRGKRPLLFIPPAGQPHTPPTPAREDDALRPPDKRRVPVLPRGLALHFRRARGPQQSIRDLINKEGARRRCQGAAASQVAGLGSGVGAGGVGQSVSVSPRALWTPVRSVRRVRVGPQNGARTAPLRHQSGPGTPSLLPVFSSHADHRCAILFLSFLSGSSPPRTAAHGRTAAPSLAAPEPGGVSAVLIPLDAVAGRWGAGS